MKKSNVYIVTECPYVGVFRAIIELSKELKHLGFSINYVLPDRVRDRYGEKQYDHEKLLKKYGNIFHQPLRRKLRFLFGDIHKLNTFFKTNKPDIVISYTEYAGKICRILYKKKAINKLYHVPSCVGVRRKKVIPGFVEYLFEKALSRHASYYLACGSSETFILNDKYKVPINKIVFLPNLRTFKKLKSKNIKYQYIYVGRMVREKGVFELLESLKLAGCISSAIFVGDGRDYELLKKQYPEANFTGRVTSEEVIKLLSVSKFFISNSIIEGLPYTLIEAMAQGVVPVVSNVEGHKDLIIDGKNGLLYNKQIDLVNSIFKSQLVCTEDYNQMKKSAQKTIINLSKLAKKNIRNNFKNYE